ncbi:MAG: hypothetical protein FWG19_00815, partial [Methanomassiliicoccaceae archaeon]|nr:hypothetical protein [Methanomassiliicoccaceae archaeon]
EAARNLEAAYNEAEARGPLRFDGPSMDEMLESGRQFLKNNPTWLNELIEVARERLTERGDDISDLTEE